MENFFTINLLDLNHTIAHMLLAKSQFPWETLSKIKNFILEMGRTLDTNIYENIAEGIWIAKTATIAHSASLAGPLIICENAEIRHCAFIRGSAIVGRRAVVGNSTELKNSILFDEVQTPHFNYIGDSILGYKSHTGAGVITSNLKSDKSQVSILHNNGNKIETGIKKFGAVIGDYVEIGCNSVLNPGTVIGRNTNIYPLSMIRGYIGSNKIYKQNGEIVAKQST